MRVAHRPADWVTLFVLAIMWGSAFLFTKIAVSEMSPVSLVASRLVIAAAILLLVVFVSRRSLRVSATQAKFFLVMALIGNCIPFFLISWGQQWIASSVAGMLMASMPLVTMALAHVFLEGEPLTARKLAGFGFGFFGVVVLLGPAKLLELGGGGNEIAGQLAVLGGAFSYACAAIVARRGPAQDSLTTATGVMIAASMVMVPLMLVSGPPSPSTISAPAVFSMLALGIVSTGLATLLYFRLIKTAGPGFLSMINYLIPLWATFLGAVVLSEDLELSAWVALALILFGMFLTQSQRAVVRSS